MSVEGQTIVNNLKERVHAVNSMVAISGIENVTTALRVLDQLITEDIVLEESHALPDGGTAKLYRYNRFRIGLQPRSAIRPVK